MSQIKVNSIIPVAGVPTGGGGGIIQVQNTTIKTKASQSLTQHSYNHYSGLDVSLTPTSSSSKILISGAIAVSAVFINLWPIIPSGNFFNNWLSMIYFYPIGFYLYFKYKNEKFG